MKDVVRAHALEVAPRFVVFGTRINGVFDLSEVLEDYIADHGISGVAVRANRDVTRIEDAFFGVGHRAIPTPAGFPELEAGASPQERVGVLQRLSRALGRTGASAEIDAHSTEDVVGRTLPLGVFVLPQMRHYEGGYMGATVDTPVGLIQRLCDAYGVPLVRAERTTTVTDAQLAFDGLIALSRQPEVRELPTPPAS